jgi:hypothetical protein
MNLGISQTDSKPWSDEELVQLWTYRQEETAIPYSTVAQRLGRTAAACETKYRRRSKWQSRLGLVEESDKLTLAKEDMNQALADKFLASADKQKVRTGIIVDKVVAAVKPFNSVTPSPVYYPRNRKSSGSPEDMGLMLSDLHIGQMHTLQETGGVSEYNIKVFKDRLSELKDRVTDIYELHSNLYPIETLNVFMLGDNVHGMANVGKWSAAHIEEDIITQMFTGAEEIADLLHYFASMFKNVKVFCVSGNHGRASHKGVEKEHVNWDYVMYKFLEAKLSQSPQVEFDIPQCWFIEAMIRNHRFYVVHGDDVKGGNFPVKSLDTATTKVMTIRRTIPDYALAGHFHQSAELTTNYGELFLNGSFVGPDVYSLKAIQAGGKPTQKVFGIHDKRGVTWRYTLDLDTRKNR